MTTYVEHFSDKRLSPDAVRHIKQVTRTGEAFNYGKVDLQCAKTLADAAVALNTDDIYGLYDIYRDYCVEYLRDSQMRVTGERIIHDGVSNGNRRLTAAEVVKVYSSQR